MADVEWAARIGRTENAVLVMWTRWGVPWVGAVASKV
jgi:hypothetical protein